MNMLTPFPQFDEIEHKILGKVLETGGRIYRTDLREEVGGSNTTFMRKLESLREKGMLDEFKTREIGGGRMKTAYALTKYASRLFELEEVLRMQKWFSASERIEIFPEFDRISRALIGDDFNVYELLGIQPQHLLIETILATSVPPAITEDQVKDLLPMINAYLQNIVTSKLHPKVEERVEGYIIFNYKMEQPERELEQRLLTILKTYVASVDPLDQHKAIGGLTELWITTPEILPKIVMAAVNISTSLKFEAELKDIKRKYRAYQRQEEPMQLTRIQLAISVLVIFKKLYDLYQENRG